MPRPILRAKEAWKALPWKKFRRIVFRLQKRIYKAQMNSDYKLVKSLQRLLLGSRAAQFLAVRQVTQLNKGKRTAGVDGKTALRPKQRLDLVEELSKGWKNWQHQKLRREWIPKPDGDKRGLGIPTIGDRAYQCLLKFALEPAAEATFSVNSYGFRPGRSTWDAQKLLYLNLKSDVKGKSKRILEMDIQKCFDRIDHSFMLNQIHLPKPAKQGLKRAIKAGVKGEFPSSESGTPQGGVISPLLANIALNGLEDIGSARQKDGRAKKQNIAGIRYADDLVFILKPEHDAEAFRNSIDQFLALRGLLVKEAKTRLVGATSGFDFLGWNFRVKDNGKFVSCPSQKNYANVKKKIKAVLANSQLKLETRIKRIGWIVRGWRNYHKYCDMSKHSLWHTRRRAWKVINKHRSKNRHQTDKDIKKAFPPVGWHVNEHVNVKGARSPFDGDMLYWAKRNSKFYDGLTAQIFKKQSFRCAHCGEFIMPEETLELHHRDGNHDNWKHSNLEVLHRECHQHRSVHASVGKARARAK